MISLHCNVTVRLDLRAPNVHNHEVNAVKRQAEGYPMPLVAIASLPPPENFNHFDNVVFQCQSGEENMRIGVRHCCANGKA
jgi:hypothetical protein